MTQIQKSYNNFITLKGWEREKWQREKGRNASFSALNQPNVVNVVIVLTFNLAFSDFVSQQFLGQNSSHYTSNDIIIKDSDI
jgi:hypothetical protein